ncbi:hypothetical protein Y695_01185 [Hydrogenophaga sp. T4]|nr:hypothetical protein Y695_01185 [Hydrogenophaga sp. T4]
MSQLVETSSYLSSLRERATTKLTNGMRSDLSRASTSEAMAVLFKLASSPSTAGDALALLHELQVHQVEVEMQHEELRCSRVELESDLIRQTARVERRRQRSWSLTRPPCCAKSTWRAPGCWVRRA